MEQLKSSELIKLIKTEKVIRLDATAADIILEANGLFLHLEDPSVDCFFTWKTVVVAIVTIEP